jgi:hypothetical protein
MPPQKGKQSFFQVFGQRAIDASKEHAGDEVDYGNGGARTIPPNMRGIAQVRRFRFSKDDKDGQWYFQYWGVVVDPKTFAGESVAGIQFYGKEPLEKPRGKRTTLADHLAFAQNEAKKLLPGLPATALTGEAFQRTMEAIEANKPLFRFRSWASARQTIGQNADGTWSVYREIVRNGVTNQEVSKTVDGKVRSWPTEEAAKSANPFADGRDPMVNVDWLGAYTSPTKQPDSMAPAMEAVDDEGGDNVDPFDGGTESTDDAALTAIDNGLASKETSGNDQRSLDDLVAAANDDEQDAKDMLEKLAVDTGVMTADEVNKAPSWQHVADAIASQHALPGNGASIKPETHQAGTICKYRPIDKTGKTQKAINVEIVERDGRAKQARIKACHDPKRGWKNVPFDQLVPT